MCNEVAVASFRCNHYKNFILLFHSIETYSIDVLTRHFSCRVGGKMCCAALVAVGNQRHIINCRLFPRNKKRKRHLPFAYYRRFTDNILPFQSSLFFFWGNISSHCQSTIFQTIIVKWHGTQRSEEESQAGKREIYKHFHRKFQFFILVLRRCSSFRMRLKINLHLDLPRSLVNLVNPPSKQRQSNYFGFKQWHVFSFPSETGKKIVGLYWCIVGMTVKMWTKSRRECWYGFNYSADEKRLGIVHLSRTKLADYD